MLEAVRMQPLQAHVGESVLHGDLCGALTYAFPPKGVAYPVRQFCVFGCVVDFFEHGYASNFAFVQDGEIFLRALCVLVVCQPARYHFGRARVGDGRCGADMGIVGQRVQRVSVRFLQQSQRGVVQISAHGSAFFQ